MTSRTLPKGGKKGKPKGGGFVALPHALLNCTNYCRLSAQARMLLIDIALQYRGANNGSLMMPWKLMKPRGWKSEATLHKAKNELLQANMIVETRKGKRPNVASLFALTWHPFDYDKAIHEMTMQGFPVGAWQGRGGIEKLQEAMQRATGTQSALKNAGLTPRAAVVSAA
jgi:hypothetical protein